MSAVHSVLIIGGGIAGLAAAVALRRQGVSVDLVEVQPDWTVYGVGIIQPNNTLRALARIGLAEACVKQGAPFPGWRICDPEGNLLIEGPASNVADARYPPVNGITRIALHNILVAAAQEAGARLMLGRTATITSNGSQGVDVAFSDGLEAHYDVVIGCDGVASPTRQHLFPDAAQPRFAGQGVWRYNLPRPKDLEWGYMFFGRKSKAGLVPLSPSLMYMLLVTPEEERFFPPEALADEFRARLNEYGGIIGELSKQIQEPSEVVYRPLTSLMLPQPWSKDHAIIIGDATHSTTPHLAQGAAMAIEDAVLLGELLGQLDDVQSVFASFMSRRYARTKFVVDTSTQLSAWELEEWSGSPNPAARPGELFNEGVAAMIEDY